MAHDIDFDAVPQGYRPFASEDGFIGHNGPLYLKRDGDALLLGGRVLPRHCNMVMIAHGGWLATLLDMTLPICARGTMASDRLLLTVSLTLDFLGPAPLGAWVEGSAEVLKQTKRMMFVQGLLRIDGAAVARGSAIFRIGPPAPSLNLDGLPDGGG